MINHLRHMAVFAKVVDKGSFRAAAKELEVAPSSVSQAVSDLEEYLGGVTLLYRTTRKLQLTHEGKLFYKHAVDIIRSAEAGLDTLNALSVKPVGKLKISLPAFLATSAISAAISQFIHQYPDVSFTLIYTDHVMDMLEEGIDLSIRAGWLADSSMMSRRLGNGRRLLVASKAYTDTKAVPKHPKELSHWDWISFSMRPATVELTSASGEKITVPEHSRVTVNSAEASWYLTRQNLGLSILPEDLVKDDLQRGLLIHVLPKWTLKSLGYYAVWPNRSRRENLTLMLVRFLAEHSLINDGA